MFAWLRKLLRMNTIVSGVKDAPSSGGGASTLLTTIGGVDVRQHGSVISWTSGLAIDADGSPRAYHPTSAWGLDALANAGKPGNWWGILTENGKPDGEPVIQGKYDPAPGFYVSTTSLCDTTNRDLNWSSPRKFVDSETIPYVVLPSSLPFRLPTTAPAALKVGDFAVVVNLANGKRCAAICADIGPADQIGEGSIALAQALGVNADARKGGCDDNILFCLFAGSRTAPAWPHTFADINARVAGLITQNHINLPNLPTA